MIGEIVNQVDSMGNIRKIPVKYIHSNVNNRLTIAKIRMDFLRFTSPPVFGFTIGSFLIIFITIPSIIIACKRIRRIGKR